MKRNIVIGVVIVILLVIVGLFLKNKDINLKSVSSLMVFTEENMNDDVTRGDAIKYQKDLSSLLKELYSLGDVRKNVYTKYKITHVPEIISINDKNTMYKIILDCEGLDKNDCIDAHNLYNYDLLITINKIYDFDIKIVDSASIYKK